MKWLLAFTGMAFSLTALAGLDEDIGELQAEWARIKYERPAAEQAKAFAELTKAADAVRGNGGGVVIATEYEPAKAAQARANFAAAGVADLIDLREGDLRQTLKTIEGPVDFVLMDIWTEMARPAMELVHPHLRPGAIVVADNTGDVFRHAYRHFFAFVNDPANGLKTMTLPFQGGLELVVKA